MKIDNMLYLINQTIKYYSVSKMITTFIMILIIQLLIALPVGLILTLSTGIEIGMLIAYIFTAPVVPFMCIFVMYEYHYHSDDTDEENITKEKLNINENTIERKDNIEMPETEKTKIDETEFCGPVKYECSKCKFMCANQNTLLEHCRNIHNMK